MPQKTNLNINPYFDDFDKDDNFYKVLFKPGFPCLLYTSPSPRDVEESRMPSSA